MICCVDRVVPGAIHNPVAFGVRSFDFYVMCACLYIMTGFGSVLDIYHFNIHLTEPYVIHEARYVYSFRNN